MSIKNDYEKILSLVNNIMDSPSAGGNISIKQGKFIYIKSSGKDLKKYSSFNEDVAKVNMINLKSKIKPSMELYFHLKLNQYVLHYHPLYINALLCSSATDEELKEVFDVIELDEEYYSIINYTTPGEELAEKINNRKPIIFLRNHGVIIHSDVSTMIERYYNYIHKLSSLFPIENHLMPDDVVLKNEEIDIYYWALRGMISELKSTPNFLSLSNLIKLSENKDELYRRNLK